MPGALLNSVALPLDNVASLVMVGPTRREMERPG